MSAILGIFSVGRPLETSVVEEMLRACRTRGTGPRDLWRDGGAVLAVVRHDWELDDDFSGKVLLLREGDCAVVADATLYARDDLRRRLAAKGVRANGATPSHLILAAYRAWGSRCAELLEGDFAFVLWDRRKRRAFCSRDFAGKRPLFYADLGPTLVVASSIQSILAHPGCPSDLDLGSVAATAAGMLSSAGPNTCFRAIRVLPSATTLLWHDGRVEDPEPYWRPPAPTGTPASSFAAGAEELREILSRTVSDRLGSSGPTAVWMSGGWDSTAVFGVGQMVQQEKANGKPLQPVSISYPPGDPGREDELIVSIARFWDIPIHWVNASEIPLFDRSAERAVARDEPFAHLYENWNCALAAGARACGARVALDGNGGDQLFQVSDVFLADLLRGGRWMELAHEWRAKGGTGFHNFFRWAIQPLLPQPLLDAAALLRGGRPLRPYLERPLPGWINPEFAKRHHLRERERDALPPQGLSSRAGAEARWYLTCPFFARGFSAVTSIALEQGVELRSPLYDRRVVEFALSRPRWERSSGPETKRLLRQAVRGLLPEAVLAPRPFRTGVTTGYSNRGMRAIYPAVFRDLFRSPLLLAELGIVDPDALGRSLSAYLDRGDTRFRVNLFHTLQTEVWLRARHRPNQG